MQKILKPQTIIPQEIYVLRSADKQIKELINDMGRPGYILVSRQMGKTNLLINAKRNVESSSNIMAYIDLSNRYDTARECFRNIIDTIIETNQEIFENAQEEILNRREKTTLTEHKEHNYELRSLLKYFSGKIIISLDEIDSLTQAAYSDKIFAQIRSVYFDRVNFYEFNRLTYILSGVAEPADIIKDSSISPFNIGQKIFLGDFSESEFHEFIVRSKISLGEDTKNRIFYWTNGNPRLTWEICSEVEDRLVENKTLSTDDIDKIVEFMYLKNFDRPPIDHIRTLISKDIKLRDAIFSIKYGKEDTLSDDIKSKLYLAGVLNSDYEEGSIKIKNRIIDHALDDEWLSNLESSDLLSLGTADSAFSNGDYTLAINQYIELLKNNTNLSFIEESQIFYKLAASYIKKEEYDKVIEYCDKCKFNLIDNKSIYIEIIWMKGQSLEKIEEYDLSRICYEEILTHENNTKSHMYFRAFFDLITLELLNGKINENTDISEKFKKFNNELEIEKNNKNTQIKESEILYWLSLSKFTEGRFYVQLEKYSNAKNCFDSCLSFAVDQSKFYPIFELLKLTNVLNLEKENIDCYFDNLISLAQQPREINFETDDFALSGRLVKDIIVYSAKLYNEVKVNKLITTFSQNLKIIDLPYDFYSIIALAAEEFIKLSDEKMVLTLCNFIFNANRKLVTPTAYFEASKLISYYDPSNEDAKNVYFKGFQNYIKTSDNLDITIFEREIIRLKNTNELTHALALCELLLSSDSSLKGDISSRMLPILFLKMLIIDSDVSRVEIAKRINQRVDRIHPSEYTGSRLNEKIIRHFKLTSNRIIVENSHVEQVRYTNKRYNRNDKVTIEFKDGTIANKKFKQIQELLESGQCKIIE